MCTLDHDTHMCLLNISVNMGFVCWRRFGVPVPVKGNRNGTACKRQSYTSHFVTKVSESTAIKIDKDLNVNKLMN